MDLQARIDVEVGDVVDFVLVVTNLGDAAVELSFRSGQVADVTVYEDGAEVWRWSDGRAFTQALQSETLEPGGSVTHEATWPDPAPGAYEAVATLAAEDADVEARARFEV